MTIKLAVFFGLQRFQLAVSLSNVQKCKYSVTTGSNMLVGLQCRIDFPTGLRAPPLCPHAVLMEEIL